MQVNLNTPMSNLATFYSTTEIAEIFRISKKTVYSLIAGGLPHVRFGNKIRININDMKVFAYHGTMERPDLQEKFRQMRELADELEAAEAVATDENDAE